MCVKILPDTGRDNSMLVEGTCDRSWEVETRLKRHVQPGGNQVLFDDRGRVGASRLVVFILLALLLGAVGGNAAATESELTNDVIGLLGDIVGPEFAVCATGVVQPIASGIPALDVPMEPQADCSYVVHLYTFDAAEDDTLLIELFGTPQSLLVALFDDENELMDGTATSENGEAAIVLLVPETGTYTIAVMGESTLGREHLYALFMDAGFDLFAACYEEKQALPISGRGLTMEFELTVDTAALPDFCRGFESYVIFHGDADQELHIRVEGVEYEIGWMWIDTLDRRPAPELVVEFDAETDDRVAYGSVTIPETGFYALGIAWWVETNEEPQDRRFWVSFIRLCACPPPPIRPSGRPMDW